MKHRALVTATALISTSFTPISFMTAPASAAVPTLSDMQQVCSQYDTDGAGTGVRVVTTAGAVDHSVASDSSTIKDVESTRIGDPASVQTPAGTRAFYSDPGRHGGSVNLFATVGWTAKNYAGSLVNQTIDEFQTDTYHFSCQTQTWQVVGHHDVTIPGIAAIAPNGWYTNPGHPVWESEAINTTICANGDGHPYGSDYGNCVFHAGPYMAGTPDTHQTVDDYGYADSGVATSETLSNGPYYLDTISYATLASEPTHSFVETTAAPYFSGDVVVCNNPGKKGGTWTGQNGWTDMTKCTTTYFNTANYISGANVFSSSSLPAQ